MDVVEGDVHPVDILVRRDDGSVATARLIAWLDVATGRAFGTIIQLPKGRGVRREDVARSFIDMVRHPHWGMPRTLYLDNGGEYGWVQFVEDAMRLADNAALFGARARMTVRARPYNSRAKRIEGVFSVLERGVFRAIPGWIGGRRERKKTANLGREPAPFPGDFAAFAAAVDTALQVHETTPQSGLGDLSPRDTFAAAVGAGWQRTDIDPAALEWCFATEELRTVRQGGIVIGGDRYVHDEIAGAPGLTKVRVRIPLIGDRDRVPVLDSHGRLLCVAERATRYGYLDPAGAMEQARGTQVQRRALRSMREDFDEIDLLGEHEALAREALPAPTPESAGTIRLSEETEAIAKAVNKLPPARKRSALDEAGERLRQQEEFFERRARRG